MPERQRKWEPVPDLPAGGSRLVQLRDDAAGLAIALEYDDRPGELLTLVFRSALAHRRSSFELFIRSWRLEVPHRLYLVDDSRWIEWLDEESDGRYVSASLAHYVITTSRDFIEVLAAERTSDRRRFIGQSREDEVHTHACGCMTGGKDERVGDEGGNIGREGVQADRLASLQDRREVPGADAEGGVDVVGQAGPAVQQHGLAPDQHEGDPRGTENRRQPCKQGGERLRRGGAH